MAIKAFYEKLMAISDGQLSIIDGRMAISDGQSSINDGPSSSCLMPIYFLKKYLYLSMYLLQTINQCLFTAQIHHSAKDSSTSKSHYSATYLGPDHLESKISIILGKKNLKSLLSSSI